MSSGKVKLGIVGACGRLMSQQSIAAKSKWVEVPDSRTWQ
jgi:hypothetical protein